MWRTLYTEASPAEAIMQKDAQLLSQLKGETSPILHLYDWEGPSATYGYFLKPETLLNLERAQECGISLARRPTGGGVVFHLWDLAFSVQVPASHSAYSKNSLENYAFVNGAVLEAVKEFLNVKGELFLTGDDDLVEHPAEAHFCMARPTKYDLILKGKKIAGAAQRQTRDGFLHQGTIALLMPDALFLEEILLPGKCIIEAMQQKTHALIGDASQIEEARKALSLLLQQTLARRK